ncbi:transcription factor HES-1-B isoform X1 [Misgurnus anguillicaudatus]|uniref:transcription factor HES-1-B isoform X1 n=1 Tax=Misgurnus anguillicaudatus TaxID=75329 RepID=UPI003CCF6879
MTSMMSGGTQCKITPKLTGSIPGHEQRCALNMTFNTKSEKSITALQHRKKSSKPIMEKRRRARINNSLGQLKTLILEALNKDTSRHSKLEKADILEMTVMHLKNLQRAQITRNSLPMLGKYRAGFCECMNEVIRFMSTHEGVDPKVKTRLLSHLASCVSHMDFISFQPQHHLGACALKPEMQQVNGPLFILQSDVSKLHNGLQFVPSSDGTFGLLIPSSSSIGLTERRNDAPQAGVSPSVQVNALDSLWRPW